MQKVDRRLALALGFAGASEMVFGTFAAQAQPAKPTGWPDATNTGYNRAPGYPGSLTPFTGTLTAGQTYSFMDFEGATITVDNVTFIGCRFASNWVDGWNVKNDANNTVFRHCTFCPPTSVVAAPPNAAWPSAGAGEDVDGTTGGGFEPLMIGHTQGYQYGIHNTGGGIVTVEYCDIWGFANAITLFGTAQKTIRYARGFTIAPPKGQVWGNIIRTGRGISTGSGAPMFCSRATRLPLSGTRTRLRSKRTSNGYDSIVVDGNFLSGFGYCVDMGHNAAGNNNLQFINNTIATDIGWHWGPIYEDFSSTFSGNGNEWRNNKLRVLPGTTPRPSSSNKFIDADDGKFVMPNGSYSTTDWNE